MVRIVTVLDAGQISFLPTWRSWVVRTRCPHSVVYARARPSDHLPGDDVVHVNRSGANGQSGRWTHILWVVRTQFRGEALLFSDVDVVWLRSPALFFARLASRKPRLEIATASDFLQSDVSRKALLEPARVCHHPMNIGIFYVARNRTGATRALEVALDAMERSPRVVDQIVFNNVWKKTRPSDADGLCGFELGGQRALAGVLSTRRFCNFFTYALFRTCHRPLALHATHLRWQDATFKKMRFRELGVWVDDAAYHLPERTLSYVNRVPDTVSAIVWDDGVPVHHVGAMRAQVAQMRAAMTLARSLNRTLLLPRVVCGCARGAFPSDVNAGCGLHDGRPATIPFACPYDDFLTPIASQLYDLRTHAFAGHQATRLNAPSLHRDGNRLAELKADVAPHVRIEDLRAFTGKPDPGSERAFSGWCCAKPEKQRSSSISYVPAGESRS